MQRSGSMPQQEGTSDSSSGASLRSLSGTHPALSAQVSQLGLKYDIKKKIELYKGSVSTVYKCLVGNGKTVVIKTYHKGKMVDKHFHKLEREIAAMRALCREVGKKGIVQLLDTFEDAHGIHLVMECCEGGDLFKRLMLHGGKLPEHWVCVEVIAPLLRVLERMHGLHLLHRDIKPENIFITADGQVKLGDFGLAIDWTKELPFSRSGTLDYMAPEVLMNPATHTQESPAITIQQLQSKNIRPYTSAVDVWAVGCLAYELVCGRPPFEVEDEKQTASLIIYSNHIHFESSANPYWADFVTQALTKDPRMRPDATKLLGHTWMRSNLERAAAAAAAAVPPSVTYGRTPIGQAGADTPSSDVRPTSDRSSALRVASPAGAAVAAGPGSSCTSSSACGTASAAGSGNSSNSGGSGSASAPTGSASPAATAQLQRTCTPSKTAHGFRTAAAMLTHRVSQQSPSTPPPPPAATSVAATSATTSPVTASGAMYSGLNASGAAQPRSAPPTQITASQSGLRSTNAGSSGGGSSSSGALRSLLDAFKHASMCSSATATNAISCTERSPGPSLSPSLVAAMAGSGSGAATHRPRSGGGGVYRCSSAAASAASSVNVTATVGSGVGGAGGTLPASQMLRTSFQFSLPSERDSARDSGRDSRQMRASFHVQIPVSDRERDREKDRERQRDVSIGGSSTAAVVGCKTPSGSANGAASGTGPPPAEYQAMLLGRPASPRPASPVQLPPQRPILSSSAIGGSSSRSSSGNSSYPPFAAAAAAASGGAGGSPSRIARSGAATTGGLVPSQGGSSGGLLSSLIRPVGSLSSAGVCGRNPSPPPERPEPSPLPLAPTAAASPNGTLGKPPRPAGQIESPGKAMASAAPLAPSSAPPSTPSANPPIGASPYTASPSHPAQPSASPSRMLLQQPQQQQQQRRPLSSSSFSAGDQGGERAAGPATTPAGAGVPASAGSLHELTRSWGAVVSISVGKLTNLVGSGRRSGSESAFSSPQRLPVTGGDGSSKALDSYGLPAPTPVASVLPPAEYCSPRPVGVLERVKHHLRGGGGGGRGGVIPSSPTVSVATTNLAAHEHTALQARELQGANVKDVVARVRTVDVI